MSSRKNNLLKFPIITAGDMSLSSLTSTVTNIQYLDNVCIQLNFTGTPTGTFEVQVSLDHAQDSNGNVTVAGNWTALTLDPSPSASGSGSTTFIDINQTSAPWIRVVYTKTSGTGTLNAFIGAKVL